MADPNQLFEEAKCYGCANPSLAEQLELALLARWLTDLNPMADTGADTLMESAKCFCGATTQVDLLRLGLLKAIAVASSPGAETDPAALLDAAKCFQCSGASIADLYELALLDEIAG